MQDLAMIRLRFNEHHITYQSKHKGESRSMQQSNSHSTMKHYRSPQLTYGLAALIITVVAGLLLNRWLAWNFYWIWFIVVNIVTFVFFRYDKSQAQKEGATRVPEVILFALMLAGGVLGGLGGMVMRPHHKTHKPMFWTILAIAAALHLYLIFAWVLA